jgi:hypothetical protein
LGKCSIKVWTVVAASFLSGELSAMKTVDVAESIATAEERSVNARVLSSRCVLFAIGLCAMI